MKEGTRNVAIGITGAVALGGLASLLLLFGELSWLWERTYVVQLVANDGGGMRAGNQVLMNGVPVGEIARVEVRPGAQFPVAVVLHLQADVDIPLGSVPTTSSGLLGGGTRVDLLIPEGFHPGDPVLPHDGSAVLQATFYGLEERVVRAISDRLGALDSTMASVGRLADNLNTLVEEPAVGAEGSPDSLRLAVRRMNQALDSANLAFRSADAWLSDPQLKADARSAVYKANVLVERATEAVTAVAGAADGIKADARQIAGRLTTLMDQMSLTLEGVERLTNDARTGEGTVGQLMSNPDLYRSLTDAAQRLRDAVAELQLLLQKIRQEGIDVQM